MPVFFYINAGFFLSPTFYHPKNQPTLAIPYCAPLTGFTMWPVSKG